MDQSPRSDQDVSAAARADAPPAAVVRASVWVECDGRLWLGAGRGALLAAIAASHSISAAARLCGMSYRRAWSLVTRMNEAASTPLVTTTTGGTGGGGARLTPAGERALRLLHRLDELRHAFEAEASRSLSEECDNP